MLKVPLNPALGRFTKIAGPHVAYNYDGQCNPYPADPDYCRL